MKKIIPYIILILVISIATICYIFTINKKVQKPSFYYDNTYYGENYDIDKVLEKCTSENFSTRGMNSCTEQGIIAWSRKISETSEQILLHLNDKDIVFFKDSQKSWNTYYNNTKELLSNTLSNNDGNINTTITLGYLYELTKQRALFLEKYLYQINQ